ncbi:CcmD family protein [Mucilaginibacter sp. CSA2-8R]|uniref:CcmD family protein n=1 Tax=Mucilaginibacter sp. CSA2-8R TaxID=3141542 RepID=UPI00315CD7A4
MIKKLTFLAVLLATHFAASAQEVEMADQLRSSGKIYVVVITIAIVFVGLAIYLFAIDRRLSKLEKNKD